MRSPKVRLYLRVRLIDGHYRYADPVWEPEPYSACRVHFGGWSAEIHPEGIYYVRFLRGDKRVWRAVGADAEQPLSPPGSSNMICTQFHSGVRPLARPRSQLQHLLKPYRSMPPSNRRSRSWGSSAPRKLSGKPSASWTSLEHGSPARRPDSGRKSCTVHRKRATGKLGHHSEVVHSGSYPVP